MYETVKMGKDDGTGGLKPSNNREVGSTLSATNGVGPPTYGPVCDLASSSNATITFTNLLPGDRTFHGHPSGSLGSKNWSQLPSKVDQNNASSGNHYVFPMQKGQNNVYVYNNKGIQAIVPYKFFKK